ncbi:MAG TPA: ABC transporter ATP-binding protein [Rhodothermales bacterium]
MIEVRALEKRFGSQPVLRGLNLDAGPGCVTAVVGPNGSGKTTLIKCVLGLVRPDAGSITIAGRWPAGSSEGRRVIGYMQQAGRFPENLTGREVIELLKRVRGGGDATDDELIRTLDLEPELDKPIRTLSGGNRQRLSALVAFLFRPEILILDEPTVGLDPVASSILKDRILRARAEGQTVILTSHIMSEVEELADRMVFLLDGAIRMDGSVDDLKRRAGEPRLERAVARLMSGYAFTGAAA